MIKLLNRHHVTILHRTTRYAQNIYQSKVEPESADNRHLLYYQEIYS